MHLTRSSLVLRPLLFVVGCLFYAGATDARTNDLYRLESPDGRIRVSIQMPADESAVPRWSATFNGKPILKDCTLGLETADAGDLMAGVRVIRDTRRSVDQRVQVLFGRSSHAADRFQEMRFSLETPQKQRTDVVIRCFNDAIALRYELPGDAKGKAVTITEETTSFGVQGDPMAYAQYLKNYKTSHEHHVTPVRYNAIPSNTLLDMPLTFSGKDGYYMAITEAALRHYAGMSLMRLSNNAALKDNLVCRLTPRPDGTKVIRPLPMETPWRVVLIADRPGKLLESQTLYCLNTPSGIHDTSWIEPGKITFHWWNGDVFDGKPGLPALSFEMAKKYIDFCASNGIPTHSITSTDGETSPWYYQTKKGVHPGPDTDVTRLRDGFDLAKIRQYAESKEVRLWTWVHQAALKGRVEEAFAAFGKMGWSGMMVDFFDHDDQASVEHAETILEAAARHRILIQLHGVWKPTGLERTYPNLMNHEGALNLEYLKWSDRCTPEHNLMMAFTRLIPGQMDFISAVFERSLVLSSSRSTSRPTSWAPGVIISRCMSASIIRTRCWRTIQLLTKANPVLIF